MSGTNLSWSDFPTGGAETVASTALNSLAAGAYTDQLDEVNNTYAGGNHCLHGALELTLGADLTCKAGNPRVEAWIIYALDGTNYPNPPSTTGAAPDCYRIGEFGANASAVFRRGSLEIPRALLPFKFKFKLRHDLHGSTAWNSTGNLLKLWRWRHRAG